MEARKEEFLCAVNQLKSTLYSAATVYKVRASQMHGIRIATYIMPHLQELIQQKTILAESRKRGISMSKENKDRCGCRDVFHAYFVKDAVFDGELEIPVIDRETELPDRMISFSDSLRTDDFDQWVHFYEDDSNFERLWNRPRVYLPRLKKFKGVISPDFSLYRDMPLVMQAWNTYRNRATGHWIQSNGIRVIPNVRWADSRSYEFCCLGVRKHSPIAIGSHGLIRIKNERIHFEAGLEYVVRYLHPSVIIVYGSAPKDIFSRYEEAGIKIIVFPSDISKVMKRGDD